jgi:hypothetical protein
MPIWLRKFTFKEIQDYIDGENEKLKASSNTSGSPNLTNPDGTANVPAFTQASKAYKNKSSYK